MAFPDTLTVGTRSYERLDNGRWILSTSTADQPHYFELTSTVNGDGESSYVVKIRKQKNSSVSGNPDAALQVHTVVRVDLKEFTQSELEAELAQLNAFLATANITKLLRGER